jgi:hypothetical protein
VGEEQGGKKLDPMEQLRGMRDAYMDAWAKTMGEYVNSEQYAQQSGATLDAMLSVSAPFRAAMEKAMVNALQQMAMPTRPDFVSIAERLTNVEMRLDDLDVKLDHIAQTIAKIPTQPPSSADEGTAPSERTPAKKSGKKSTNRSAKKKGVR